MTWNLPNKLTVARAVMVPFFAAALLWQRGEVQSLRYLALFLFVAASFTDYLDGHIARKYNLVTNFGKFMDPLADKLLVCTALICFVELGSLPAWIVSIVIAREFIISGFRLVASDQGVVIAASMWGKSKTVSQMAAIVLLILGFDRAEGPLRYLTLFAVGLMTVLTVVSLMDYLSKNRQVLMK
jgi:CDP-diacylglycerol--glycerol-3-phosphate 3-phosphatidyltransferase